MSAPLVGGTSRPAYRVLAFTGLVFALLTAVLFPILPGALDVREGDIAAQTTRAPDTFSYESAIVRQSLQEQAARSVRDVVTYDVNVKSGQLARLTDTVNRAGAIRDSPGMTRAAREDSLQRVAGLTLTNSQRGAVVDMSPEGWRQVVDESVRVLGALLEEPFGASDLEDRRASVPARIAAGLTAVQGDLVVALVKPLVVTTQRVDEAATRQAVERATAAIGPQHVTYARNQVIVREGEPIDAAKLEALREAGLLNARVRPGDVLAVALVSLLSALSLGVYLLVLQPPSLGTMRRLTLVAVVVGAVALAAKLYLPLVTPDPDHRYYAYLVPVALAPLVVASLFEAPFAVLVAAVVALVATFSAVYLPNDSGVVSLGGTQALGMAATFFFGGLAGALAIHRAERLNRFFLAGLAVAVASFLGLLTFWAMDPQRARDDLLWMLGVTAGAGALTALLAVGLSAVLGTLFDVTTRLQLMELAQLNAPLLRRLQEEAPGTFHHSVLVGNLAERAADKIGADPLLVRVGAYYHDIGKMARPVFFIENQLAGENPHDLLDPATSARMIQEHVTHGLELARRHRLPERVRAFIPEHHGTRTVVYFYRMAQRDDPAVDEQRFRYPGPRPQTRETALVMLADSTEAAVRASGDRSQPTIDGIVDGILAERLAEGQFDDCDITMKDLRIVATSFKSSLRAIYHPRIEYPPAITPHPTTPAAPVAESDATPEDTELIQPIPTGPGHPSEPAAAVGPDDGRPPAEVETPPVSARP